MIKIKNIKDFIISATQIGTVTVAVKSMFRAPFDGFVASVQMKVGTAGTTSSQIGDVTINGTSIFATAGNKPTLASTVADTGDVQGGSVIDGTRTFSKGDLIRLSVTQVNTTPATDLSMVAILKQRNAGRVTEYPD